MRTEIKLFLLILVGIYSCSNKQSSNILIDLTSNAVLNEIKSSSDVEVSLHKINQFNKVQIVVNADKPINSVVFNAGKQKWNLSRYQFLAVDITNPGKNDLLIECRPDENAWLGSGQIFPAGKTTTIRVPIIRDLLPEYFTKKLFGMNAFPGGIIKMWGNIEPDSINRFSIVLINAPRNSAILINNIRAEGEISFPPDKELSSNYFPLLDEFGQLKNRDWKGKVHSLEELINSKESELDDMKANTAKPDWNKYGGWQKGPQLKATGSFRTEKLDGRWWLVDPSGCLFWSHGLGTVMLDEATPITEREHYFSYLPDSSAYHEFYGNHTYSPKGYYRGRSMRVFRQHAWNLFKKYGDQWRTICGELAHKRLRSWNMNTIGGWSDSNIFGLSKTPYTETLSSNSQRIEGSEGQWYKFPDPFDPVLRSALIADVNRIRKSTNDPFCIGYFVDNELYWGDDSYIARAVVQSGPDQPAKKAMVDFLQKKYKNIESFNRSRNTGYTSWKEVLESSADSNLSLEDLKLFSAEVAGQYFRIIKETLGEVAPGKLYLGCRFDFHYYPAEDTTGNWAVRIAGKYCDVVSFNRYRYSALDLVPLDADKPIMIGEWHMGALDRGMLHFSLRFAEDQENRAEMYKYYIQSCLENPWIVGAHWFQYYDEPTLGRFDGENYNTGFLDVCDRPYSEMVRAARETGASMYQIRFGGQVLTGQ